MPFVLCRFLLNHHSLHIRLDDEQSTTKEQRDRITQILIALEQSVHEQNSTLVRERQQLTDERVALLADKQRYEVDKAAYDADMDTQRRTFIDMRETMLREQHRTLSRVLEEQERMRETRLAFQVCA